MAISSALLKGGIKLFGKIPFKLRSSIGGLLGTIAGSIPFREQRLASEQLRFFLADKNPARTTRRVFAHIGSVAGECFNLNEVLKDPSQFIYCEDESLIQHYIESDKATVALTAHLGNWELLAAYMCLLGVPVVTIARAARKAVLHEFLRDKRESYGVSTIWRGGISAQKEIVRALESGKTVAALIDQDTYVSGQPSEFFSHFVQTPSALVELAKRSNANLVTAFNYRDEDGRYRVEVKELNTELSVSEIIDLYNQRLEEVIRKAPEQWVWFHKRWRSLPSGERLSSTEYMEFLKGEAA